jgi:hypothetical protein
VITETATNFDPKRASDIITDSATDFYPDQSGDVITATARVPVAYLTETDEELQKMFKILCPYPFPPVKPCQSLCERLTGHTGNEPNICVASCLKAVRVMSKEGASTLFKASKIPAKLSLKQALLLANKKNASKPGREKLGIKLCDRVRARDNSSKREWKSEFALSCEEFTRIGRDDVMERVNECLGRPSADYAVCLNEATCTLY